MRRVKILFFVVLLFSCKSSVPKDVLPPKKMQAVLWDVMQADEMAEYYSGKDSTFRGLAKHVDYYQKVFSIHKINKEDFTRSLTYYEDHPASFKIVLDSLQNFAERLQKADSLKNSYHFIGNDTTKRKLIDTLHPK
jgi:hypothetical protein